MEGGSKNIQTAKQEVVDLSKFLYLLNPDECDVSNVTMMTNIVTYLNELRKSGVGPSGQVTKLTTILNALKMIVSTMPDNGIDEESKDLVVRATVVETKVKGISKSLRKECNCIRLQKREMFDGERNVREKVLTFLEDNRLSELIDGYIRKPEMSEAEQLMSRRFLMCYMVYTNAQRQGAVVNLRLTEQSRAVCHNTKNGESVFVYKVWQHKTSGQFGSANLVVPEKIHRISNMTRTTTLLCGCSTKAAATESLTRNHFWRKTSWSKMGGTTEGEGHSVGKQTTENGEGR